MPSPDYETDIREFGELSPHALYELLKLRVDVFVVEQQCPYPELDGKDEAASHVRLLDNGALLAATRIIPPVDAQSMVRICRVVVSPHHRGKRLGEAVMQTSIKICRERFPDSSIIISAQSHLQKFYGAMGFSPVSEEYLEDNIPHIDMVLEG